MLEQDDKYHALRHSAAHIMASAVCKLYPDTKFGIGPVITDGFYYDFVLDKRLSETDLEEIEKIMQQEIDQNLSFEKQIITRSEALDLFSEQPFKLEIIEEIDKNEDISIYEHGGFQDLCAGPHVDSSKDVKAFKLLSVAGAYWRGDEKRPMMQRIYGTAFDSLKLLDNHLELIEEAKKRDHRVLGKELDLFFMDPIAPASPFFLPKGTIIYNELINYVRELYHQYEYQEVITPQIFSTDLWKQSGHYDNYKDNMYFVLAEDREFGIKPMNCPAHAVLYKSGLRSYRELPFRVADFGRLHRFERSGVVQGLTRVRPFSQDDAHIFCTIDQVDHEIDSLIAMFKQTYDIFNFNDVRIALSLRPDKRVGDEEMWDKAESKLQKCLEDNNINFKAFPGEGAFYGPKVDFFVPDALGREWQLGTIQLDFSLPERFDLEYVNEDGQRSRPVMVHRAMLGSLERFMGVLIEHFAGSMPPWLSPSQVLIIPIADRHLDKALELKSKLTEVNIRTEIDSRNERMNSKIREGQMNKTPYMVILGDKEIESEVVSVRLRTGENLQSISVEEFITRIKDKIDKRAIELW